MKADRLVRILLTVYNCSFHLRTFSNNLGVYQGRQALNFDTEPCKDKSKLLFARIVVTY